MGAETARVPSTRAHRRYTILVFPGWPLSTARLPLLGLGPLSGYSSADVASGKPSSPLCPSSGLQQHCSQTSVEDLAIQASLWVSELGSPASNPGFEPHLVRGQCPLVHLVRI